MREGYDFLIYIYNNLFMYNNAEIRHIFIFSYFHIVGDSYPTWMTLLQFDYFESTLGQVVRWLKKAGGEHVHPPIPLTLAESALNRQTRWIGVRCTGSRS